jgi:hypothetical protein
LHAHNEPHDEITRLEERIEELHAKIETCRKFVVASRIAVTGGGIVLVAMLVGAKCSETYFGFRGTADIARLATGSTRSRMCRHGFAPKGS